MKGQIGCPRTEVQDRGENRREKTRTGL
jgi:hypothetical protein